MTRTVLSLLLLVTATTPAFAQDPDPKPWYERLRFGGDFRARYEGFYEEDVATRNRARMRLRLRVDAEINRDLDFRVQLASGDPGTPVSTNQTFTGFFLPKPVHLDRAYLVYNPDTASALTLGLGKFPTPLAYTQMILDDDLNFEGGWEQVAWEPRDGLEVTLASVQTAVNEASAGADSYMVAGYGAVGAALGRHRLRISAANYAWGNPDQIAAGSADGPLESILTNALRRDASGGVIGYESGFNVIDVIAEGTIQTGRDSYPVRLLAEIARNTRAANDRESGLWLEAEYGDPGEAGEWGVAYTYGRVEQDVTPSAFVFSDMPGTNVRLHMIEHSHVVAPALSLDTTLHFTRPLVPDAGVEPRWLTRLHLAAVVRF